MDLNALNDGKKREISEDDFDTCVQGPAPGGALFRWNGESRQLWVGCFHYVYAFQKAGGITSRQRTSSTHRSAGNPLFDQLAARTLRDPASHGSECPHSFEEVRAVALTLCTLTKPAWDAGDLRLLDACRRTACRSALFAGEFEAERLRIQHGIEAVRENPGRSPPLT
jgi:hypothetical protein